MPRLEILESRRPQRVRDRHQPRQYSITVTRGLLAALDDAEIEAVLAHELTHIRNDDVRVMVIAVVIAGIVSFFGELVLPRHHPNALFRARAPLREAPRTSSDFMSGKGGGASSRAS